MPRYPVFVRGLFQFHQDQTDDDISLPKHEILAPHIDDREAKFSMVARIDLAGVGHQNALNRSLFGGRKADGDQVLRHFEFLSREDNRSSTGFEDVFLLASWEVLFILLFRARPENETDCKIERCGWDGLVFC